MAEFAGHPFIRVRSRVSWLGALRFGVRRVCDPFSSAKESRHFHENCWAEQGCSWDIDGTIYFHPGVEDFQPSDQGLWLLNSPGAAKNKRR